MTSRRGVILLALCAVLLAVMAWIMLVPERPDVPEMREPKISIVIPLRPENGDAWKSIRQSAANRRMMDDGDTVVTCVGRSEGVWIYEWLWLNKGRDAAYAFLDWISEDDDGGRDVREWLRENGWPTLGEMRRWCEDHPELISAEFRKANEKALSVEDGQISIFGGRFEGK